MVRLYLLLNVKNHLCFHQGVMQTSNDNIAGNGRIKVSNTKLSENRRQK